MEVPMKFNYKRIIAGLVFASILGTASVPAHAGFLDGVFKFWTESTEQKEQNVTDFVKNSGETGKLVLAAGALAVLYAGFRAISKDKAKPSTLLFGLLGLLGFTADAAAQRMNEGKKVVEDSLGLGTVKNIVTGVAQTTQEANGVFAGVTNFINHVKTFFKNLGTRFGSQTPEQVPLINVNNNNQPEPSAPPMPNQQQWSAHIYNNMQWATGHFEQCAQIAKKSIDDFLDTKNNETFQVHMDRMGQFIAQMKNAFIAPLQQHIATPAVQNDVSAYKQIIQATDTVAQTMIKMIDDIYTPLSKKDANTVLALENPMREQNKKLEEAVKQLHGLLVQNGQPQMAARIVNAFELLKQNGLQQIMDGGMGVFALMPALAHRFTR